MDAGVGSTLGARAAIGVGDAVGLAPLHASAAIGASANESRAARWSVVREAITGFSPLG